jgi:amidase
VNSTVHQLTAGEICEAITQGQLSALEVTRALLERIQQVNPTLNAVCTLDPSAEDQAREVDARRASGDAPRLLEGVPFLAKDNLETAGLLTTYGSKLLADNVPGSDALCVARMRAAGAVLLGKTNTPEFAADINTDNPVFGQTRNPWDLNTTPGGSSGGTGAAVAAGLAPVGLGTDLGGSIRIPASFNGICGIRPCPGRVPVYPQSFAWETLIPHVHGPLARNVGDLGRALAALAGPDEHDPLSLPDTGTDFAAAACNVDALEGQRIGFVGDLDGLVPVEPQVMTLAREASNRLHSLGVPARFPRSLPEPGPSTSWQDWSRITSHTRKRSPCPSPTRWRRHGR